jgi:hypothetical protein
MVFSVIVGFGAATFAAVVLGAADLVAAVLEAAGLGAGLAVALRALAI